MKKTVIALGVATAVALASVAGASAGTAAKARAASGANCAGTITIPLLSVLTGPAAFLGNDQLSWAKLAAAQEGPKLGYKFDIVGVDTTLDPAVAATAAQKVIATDSYVVAIGPATSGGSAAVSKSFLDASIAHISPSATTAALTKSVGGKPPTATGAFYRVVADDSVQGIRDAQYIVDTLKAKKVTIIDAQEPYSVGLSDIVGNYLKAKGVTVDRQSVTNNTTDFSALVTKISKDTDVVFTPWQVASNAQSLGVGLREAGKSAIVFGTDGTDDPSSFKLAGSYVSNFGPDISADPAGKVYVDAWNKANPGKTFSSFGPPAYLAAQVAMQAIATTCNKNQKTYATRGAVFGNVRSVKVTNPIYGSAFKFSTKTHDPLNGSFWLFQIGSDGKYKQIGKLG
jgi:branched-chain amino acid transport system substrate-binding protein